MNILLVSFWFSYCLEFQIKHIFFKVLCSFLGAYYRELIILIVFQV